MSNVEQAAPQGTTAPAQAGAGTSQSRGPVQLKQAVAGQPLDVQLSMLTPAAQAPAAQSKRAGTADAATQDVQQKGSGRAVQRLGREAPQQGPVQFMGGAMMPMGDSTAVCVVQMEETTTPAPAPGAGGTGGDASTEPPAEIRYKWVSKSVEGKPVHYLIKAEDGDVQLGVVQRHELTENFDLETRVRALELTIGQIAEGHASSVAAARALAQRCITVASKFFEYVPSVKYLDYKRREKTATLTSTLGGDGANKWAGAVELVPETITALGTSGNVREALTLANNFVYNFGDAFVNAEGKDSEMEQFITQFQSDDETFTERLQAMGTTDNQLVPNDSPLIKEQITEQQSMRGNAPEEQSRRTTKTVGELRAELRKDLPLSQNELTMMGLSEAQGVSKEELAQKQLTWDEGMRNFIIKSTAFTQKLQSAAVPMGAGTSGTTARIMSLGSMLGFTDPISLRAACIGYLIPIRAHTLWEVLQGAVAGGAPAPAQDLTAFKEVQPFGPSRAIYPDEDFWQAIDDHLRKTSGGA